MSRRPLRITHLMPQIGVGGAELQLCRLVSATPAGRATHRVIYYGDSLDNAAYRIFRESGVDLLRVPRQRWRFVRFFRALTDTIAKGEPDILHCWMITAALWGRWAGAVAGIRRIVVSFRSTSVEFAPLLRLSCRAGGRGVFYLANTGAVADAVSGQAGVPRSRIAVIPNGVEPPVQRTPEARAALLSEYRCPAQTRIVTMVGRLTDAKNYPMLFRLAVRCHGLLPVHFFIVGHGEEESRLLELAERMQLLDTVHFLGLRLDIPRILSATDIFCYTSRFEGFPNALLEAMAAGLPIVTTDFAGVEELVQDGISAHVVAQDDDAAAFRALSELISDPLAAAHLAEAARATTEARFSIGQMVENTLQYYERISEPPD